MVCSDRVGKLLASCSIKKSLQWDSQWGCPTQLLLLVSKSAVVGDSKTAIQRLPQMLGSETWWKSSWLPRPFPVQSADQIVFSEPQNKSKTANEMFTQMPQSEIAMSRTARK